MGAKAINRTRGCRHRAHNVVSVNIVRPDDGALTEPLAKMRDQMGEGVSSEASSEVEPDTIDRQIEVPPGGPTERATVVRRIHCSSRALRLARAHSPSIIRRRCPMESLSTPSTSVSRSAVV